MFQKGNYEGARVRFVIARRKAEREGNYYGKDQCTEYRSRSEECTQHFKDAERNYTLGYYETARRYYDRIAELNPQDPFTGNKVARCRLESDYLAVKKQADTYFDNASWNQAYALYSSCLDSTRLALESYKRFHVEMEKKRDESFRQMNIMNPDSLKQKWRKFQQKVTERKDTMVKKYNQKKEDKKQKDSVPPEKNTKKAGEKEAFLMPSSPHELNYFGYLNCIGNRNRQLKIKSYPDCCI